MPGTNGFTVASFKAADVPVGTKLYTHPASSADRVAELEAQLAESREQRNRVVATMTAELERMESAHRRAAWRADSLTADLAASREREGRMRELLEDMRYELHQYTEGFDVIWGRVDAALAAEKEGE